MMLFFRPLAMIASVLGLSMLINIQTHASNPDLDLDILNHLSSANGDEVVEIVTIRCTSDIGWIEVYFNKDSVNNQALGIYSQAGLGPNYLESSYITVGNNNSYRLDENKKIYLSAKFTSGYNLTIENSTATLTNSLAGAPQTYRYCFLKK